jgi:putative nucleotidyltransferase with HDIG domain
MTARLASSDREASRSKAWARSLTAFLLAVSAAHFAVSVGTHREHVVHVAFSGLYLLGIIASSLWFGLSGGFMAALAVSLAYLAHILVSWRGQPMENANQYATIGVYLLVGLVSGSLVEGQRRERRRRLQSERHAQREALVQAIAGLSSALEFRDDYTRAHSERVSRLALAIGRRLAFSLESLERLRLAALMHDVGKIGVPDDILFKPDRLSAEERARIERHPVIAAQILRPIRGTEEIAEIVLCHHECPDGTGYPRGLTGSRIPREAHALRVADVFSALTDARAYKPERDARSVLEFMRVEMGTKLDQRSVEALAEVLAEGDLEWPGGSLERSATGLPTRKGASS